MRTESLYSFDDHPEHRAELAPWAQKWIDNAMSTQPIQSWDEVVEAVTGLYEAANLAPPQAHRILHVQSPMTAAIAASIAAGVRWLRAHPGKHREIFGRDISDDEAMAAIGMACLYAVAHGQAELAGLSKDERKSLPTLVELQQSWARVDRVLRATANVVTLIDPGAVRGMNVSEIYTDTGRVVDLDARGEAIRETEIAVGEAATQTLDTATREAVNRVANAASNDLHADVRDAATWQAMSRMSAGAKTAPLGETRYQVNASTTRDTFAESWMQGGRRVDDTVDASIDDATRVALNAVADTVTRAAAIEATSGIGVSSADRTLTDMRNAMASAVMSDTYYETWSSTGRPAVEAVDAATDDATRSAIHAVADAVSQARKTDVRSATAAAIAASAAMTGISDEVAPATRTATHLSITTDSFTEALAATDEDAFDVSGPATDEATHRAVNAMVDAVSLARRGESPLMMAAMRRAAEEAMPADRQLPDTALNFQVDSDIAYATASGVGYEAFVQTEAVATEVNESVDAATSNAIARAMVGTANVSRQEFLVAADAALLNTPLPRGPLPLSFNAHDETEAAIDGHSDFAALENARDPVENATGPLADGGFDATADAMRAVADAARMAVSEPFSVRNLTYQEAAGRTHDQVVNEVSGSSRAEVREGVADEVRARTGEISDSTDAAIVIGTTAAARAARAAARGVTPDTVRRDTGATETETEVATRGATGAATRNDAHNAMIIPVGAGTFGATEGVTSHAMYEAARAAAEAATSDVAESTTKGVTLGAASFAVQQAVSTAAREATLDGGNDPVFGATRDAVHAATEFAVDAVTIAAGAAADAATRAAIRVATSASADAPVSGATDMAATGATLSAGNAATRDVVDASTRLTTRVATNTAVHDATRNATRAATEDAVDAATSSAALAATDAATRNAIRDAVNAGVNTATRRDAGAGTLAPAASGSAATSDTTAEAIRAAIFAATRAARDFADPAIHGAINTETNAAVRQATDVEARNETRVAVRGVLAATYAAADALTRTAAEAAMQAAANAARAATDNTTAGETGAASYSAAYEDTFDAVENESRVEATSAMFSRVRSETQPSGRQVTYGATRAALNATGTTEVYYPTPGVEVVAFLIQCLPQWWRMHNGGSDWSAYVSYLSFFRHVAKLDLPIYEKWRHYETLATISASRMMHPDFCVVSDRHTSVHVDAQNRPHNESGPSRTWADGWATWHWHGTMVPQSLIEGRWTVADILREPNAEIRRCAIERMGWPEFVEEAKLVQVGDPCPDPGNPGQVLTLYDVPEQIYEEPIRVLLCTNGTVERDGVRRRFGLTVPANIATPLAAQAWIHTDDDHPVVVTPEVYAQLARRC